MKRIFICVFCLSAVSCSFSAPNINVFRADGETLLKYKDIMVGTQLTLVISSDTAHYWSGSVALYDPNIPMAEITGRDYNGFAYEGSCLPMAGGGASVYDWIEQGVRGFDLYVGYTGVMAGDWFVLDYRAVKTGECVVQMHDHNIPYGPPILIQKLRLTHVPTRDFDSDGLVNYSDLAILATYWGQTDITNPAGVEGTDLSEDGTVDIYDLMLFSDYWLESTH